MNILLYVSIAWVTLCVLFVGLDLVFLLIVQHASDTSQATGADEIISDQAPHMAKLDLAMDETVRRQARELADTFGALVGLEDTVPLATPRCNPGGRRRGRTSDPAHGRRGHSRSKTNTGAHLERSAGVPPCMRQRFLPWRPVIDRACQSGS
jgi:hypothetical protein